MSIRPKISAFWTAIVGIFVVWAASELWIGGAVVAIYKNDIVGFEFSHSKLDLFLNMTLSDGPLETTFEFRGSITPTDEHYKMVEEVDGFANRPELNLFPAPVISFSGVRKGFIVPYWLVLAVMFVIRIVLRLIKIRRTKFRNRDCFYSYLPQQINSRLLKK